MVHPMIAGTDYQLDMDCAEPDLKVVVDEEEYVVRVYRSEVEVEVREGVTVRVVFRLLEHDLFMNRPWGDIYPTTMTDHDVLCFFSLWNQAVAALLMRDGRRSTRHHGRSSWSDKCH